MFKTSLVALGFAAVLAGPAAADQWYTDAQLKTVSPRISSQIISETRSPDGVDGFTTRSISTDSYAAPAQPVSPRIADQLVSGDR